MDSTWIPAPQATVAAVLAQPSNWRRWWPALDLGVHEWRGPKGMRWVVRRVEGHPGLTGTAEVWLQPSRDGVIAHFFLRLDVVPGGRLTRSAAVRLERRCRLDTKHAFWTLADDLDPGRVGRLCSTRGGSA